VSSFGTIIIFIVLVIPFWSVFYPKAHIHFVSSLV